MISPATIAAKWLLPPPESSTPQPAISATTSRDATTYPTRRPGEIDLENDPSRSTDRVDGVQRGRCQRHGVAVHVVVDHGHAVGRRDLEELLGAGAVEAAAGRVGERRHEVEQAVAACGAHLVGEAREIVRVGPAGVAGEADDAQPVVAEDPQREEVGRLLDEHDVTRHGAQRQDQVECARAAGRDQHLVGVDRVVDRAVVLGNRFPNRHRARGSAVGQHLPTLGGQHRPRSPRRRRRWPAPTDRDGPRSGRSRPRYGCTARRRRVRAPDRPRPRAGPTPVGLRNVHRAPSRKVPTAQLVCPTSGSRGVAGCGANVDARVRANSVHITKRGSQSHG